MMKKNRGMLCMAAGTLMIVSAIALAFFNQIDDKRAGSRSKEVMQEISDAILLQKEEKESEKDEIKHGNENDTEMESGNETVVPEIDSFSEVSAESVIEIAGYEYIGYLSIPILGLELPVMSEWDYPRLRIAPCRYHGSLQQNDLVIAAHNYSRHFGTLSTLDKGAKVIFTDMSGKRSIYEVALIENLGPRDVLEMLDTDYELTLYTCTFGGASRVTVRCRLIFQDMQADFSEYSS